MSKDIAQRRSFNPPASRTHTRQVDKMIEMEKKKNKIKYLQETRESRMFDVVVQDTIRHHH